MIDRRTGERVSWHKRPEDFTAECEGWIDWYNDAAIADHQKRQQQHTKRSPWFSFAE
jgi:hypothetical protein